MSGRAVLTAVVILVLAALAAAYMRMRPPAEEPSAPSPAGYDFPQVYATSSQGFSIRLPKDYAVDESYRYLELGPGKEIYGVKFAFPEAKASGTNLSPDSYVSVEEILRVNNCSAALFLWRNTKAQEVTEAGTVYSVASSTGAAAGNRYEETVYALPGTNPCVAVRYFVHYGTLENYPPGTVREFDQQALLAEFDAIRRTLIVVQ